jgi:peptidoglycan hydrolase-like protein with peptidoglycan-binding domain
MPLKPEHYAPAEPVSPVEAPKVETPAVVAPEVFKVLHKGDKGTYVKKLQTALKVTADGDFGPITEKAVKAYQTKKGIVVTGIVDIETWKRLGL